MMSFKKFKFIGLLNNKVLLNKFYGHFQMCEFGVSSLKYNEARFLPAELIYKITLLARL